MEKGDGSVEVFMPINDKLRPFLKLQEIDAERWQLRKVLESGEKRREDPRKRLQAARQVAAAAEAVKLEKEKVLGDAQLRLKLGEEQLQKLEKQMQSLHSGREYRTMENQIKGKKADNSLIETEILTKMEELEVAKKGFAETQESLRLATEDSKKVDADVSRAAMASLMRLEELDAQAAEAERPCDRDFLGQYKTLLPRRNGVVIVRVINRICQGCYTAVTPNEEHRAMAGQIVTCSSCQRYIYLA